MSILIHSDNLNSFQAEHHNIIADSQPNLQSALCTPVFQKSQNVSPSTLSSSQRLVTLPLSSYTFS